jgi:hypothetical protein
LVLYGDLEPHMNGVQPFQLTHGAESMKLLPPNGFPATKAPSYDVVTQGCVAFVDAERPTISAASASRVRRPISRRTGRQAGATHSTRSPPARRPPPARPPRAGGSHITHRKPTPPEVFHQPLSRDPADEAVRLVDAALAVVLEPAEQDKDERCAGIGRRNSNL